MTNVVKILLATFVLWHMAATGIYSLYKVEKYPVLAWLDSKRNFVKPYVLITSQWQRWNLFSPDPLRRVIAMDIQRKVRGDWTTVFTLDEHSVSPWRRATELKIMRRMEDDEYRPLQERYVHDYCRLHSIPAGAQMRLQKRWFVIPKTQKDWSKWQPKQKEKELLQTTCPG